MVFESRHGNIFVVLAGLFITNAILGEVLGVKLIHVGPLIASIGVIFWPVVFLMTDIMHDHFGKKGVQYLTFLTTGLLLYVFFVIYLTLQMHAANVSPVTDDQFNSVFGQSLWIIVGSITAFLVSQLFDIVVFHWFKNRTGARKLWLRTTGSTLCSQLLDTFVVQGIAFWIPGKVSTLTFLNLAFTSYLFKCAIAIAMTPIIYLVHFLMKKLLGPPVCLS